MIRPGIRVAGVLAVLLFSKSSFAENRVDISWTYYLPKVDGIRLSAPIPTEIDYRSQNQTISAEVPETSVENLLLQAGLDPTQSNVEVERKVKKQIEVDIPQCQESNVSYKMAFEVTVKDSDWLKSKSFFCRIKRIFGGCKPERKDLLNLPLAFTSPQESHEKVSEKITKLEAEQCVTPPTNPETDYQKLLACMNNENESSGCKAQVQKLLTNLDQRRKLERDDSNWYIRLITREKRTIRQTLEPKKGFQGIEVTEMVPRIKRLVSLKVGDLKEFQLSKENQSVWVTSPVNLKSFLQQNLKKDYSESETPIIAKYELLVPETQETEETIESNVKLPSGTLNTKAIRVNNLPLLLVLSPEEVLEIETWEDLKTHRRMLKHIRDVCNKMSRYSKFGAYMCNLAKTDPDRLVRHSQVRVTFLDQEGNKRFVIYERQAPLKSCAVSTNAKVNCNFRGTNEDWVKDPTSMILSVFEDPSYKGARFHFLDNQGFIPRLLEDGPIPSLPLTPQFTDFELISD